MTRFKLTVAYDGTEFLGWQVQPNGRTVQGTLEQTLQEIVGQARVKVHGSGRTDQGVHARGQVAHVDLETRMGARAILRALNARLPRDVRIMKSEPVEPDFHARRNAHGKEYRYFIHNSETIPPDRRLYALHDYHRLDLDAMRRAAAHFVGEHDVATFMAAGSIVPKTTVRTIYHADLVKNGSSIRFRVSGNGFLYRQVRSMVGYLLRIGRGEEDPDSVRQILLHPIERKARVPTAPPQGLFLWKVWYATP